MDELPPLPEPGSQSPDDRRAIGRRFLMQAAQYLLQGDRLQAGEKAWGAVAHNLKAIGEQRGWQHDSHQLVHNIGRQIVAETSDAELSGFISDVYHLGHENFYENQRSRETLREVIYEAEMAVSALETLQQAPPRPFTIASNTQRRRLMALTGNGDLQIGDISPVGFSLKHAPNGAGDSGNPETAIE